MKVLGLDLSTKPGFAVLEAVTDDGPQLVKYGTFFDLKKSIQPQDYYRLVPEYESIDRAQAVAAVVAQLISEHSPDLIIIEQSNQGKGISSMKSQEFIHSSVLIIIRELGFHMKTRYIYSAHWRSLCGQKLSKEQRKHNKLVKSHLARGKIRGKHLAVDWVNQKFGLTLKMKDEDAADAISIAYGGLMQYNKVTVGKINVDKIFE